MELDVRLTREGEEPWGFVLVGGADYEIPLTIDRVFPSSPASAAGLQPGDVVARLGDQLTTELSLEAAEATVAEAVGSLSLGICRGLYDPVLDDYEPVYETERADSDLRSEPTEVTYPIEPTEISLETLNDFLDSGVYSNPLTDRSLTASPFVPNTKPYRPFSTEPLPVPPVEDPIILNPNYNDQFGEAKALEPEEDDLLRLLPLEKNAEAKYKLPVSDKYDPNWEKRVAEMLARIERGEFVQTTESQVTSVEVKEIKEQEVSEVKKESMKKDVKYDEAMTKEEIEFDHTMRKEIDMEKIEQTAIDIVEESIERAVSVAEEIQKEVEVEMRASTEESHEESRINVETNYEESKSTEMKEEVALHEITESVIEKLKIKEQNSEIRTIETKDIAGTEEMLSEKLKQDQECVEKIRLSKEMEEMIEAENVNRKSSTYETTDTRQQQVDHEVTEPSKKGDFRKASQFEEKKSETVKEYSSSEAYNAAMQTEGKQKAFMIGLQTMPHIKGFVQSSYHFDLLIRTFFVHLTDVMVALSRFILTQPATDLESKAERVITEKLIKDLRTQGSSTDERKETEHRETKERKAMQEVREERAAETELKLESKQKEIFQTENVERKQNSHHSMEQLERTEQRNESLEINLNGEEKKRKSGAEMALMSQRKSKDLTQKMEAVITEFETKTGKETLAVSEVSDRRRSRSRSQIEEEVMKESDPLEWLDKVDSRRASQERTDVRTEKKEFSSFAESKESKITESKRESRVRSTKVKPGKQTYIAIVESHVYTNQDAILEDQAAEISETASVQSSEDIQTATESMEAISTENVAMNHIASEEKQQAVEVISQALEEVVQEKQESLEAVSDFSSSQIVEEHSKSVMEESLIKAASESTYVSSEAKHETFEAKEMKEAKAVSIVEESYKESAVKTTDISLESSQELTESKITSHQATSKQELLASIAAETTEVISDSKAESFETKELKESKATVKSEEIYKTAAVAFEEVALEAMKEVAIKSKVSKHEAVSKQELLSTVAAQSTEIIIDDSKVEEFEAKEMQTKKAVTSSEETFKTAAIGLTEVTLEAAKEEYSKLEMKTEHVAVREETQDLAVAEVTETKAEICKKPPEDEYASLKIVKHQMVDAESAEMTTISEESIRKSVEISSSFQSHESHQSIQESSSIQSSKLLIRTDLAQQKILETSDENNNTPSPSTVPPTPLTDEYVFKLTIPLPKDTPPIPLEDTPEDNADDEDPHIVKKRLVPHIETKIEDTIIYDPPLPTPPEDKVASPVYTKPGLRGGAEPLFRKEYIREIERKSSLLASAIDQTIKSIEEYKEEVGIENKKELTRIEEKITNGYTNGHVENGIEITEDSKRVDKKDIKLDEEGKIEDAEERKDVLPGFKPVVFNPEAFQANLYQEVTRGTCEIEEKPTKVYLNESGEPLGTIHGIVDGLEDAVVNEEVAKQLGKPGITEEKIAELISGEAEMLREAHVMGLTRVLSSHMSRPADSSVDFQKIKPLVDSLKDSEVIKALNEELKREKSEEKKKQEKWTTFLQKPKRPVPRVKFGYHGYVEPEKEVEEEPYKVKIVKQPKPKVAPDYKPEDFDTGPLPWEERALTEPEPPPVDPEDLILVPEETPEFLEAVDPLPESEVPDLEDTGIPLPPKPASPAPVEELPELPEQPQDLPDQQPEPEEPQQQIEEPAKEKEDMDQNRMAEQLVNSVKSMVDPNATLEQQLAQMRVQLAALAQLPAVIQQSLELLTKQLSSMSHQESHQMSYEKQMAINQQYQENTTQSIQQYEVSYQNNQEETQNNQEVTQNYQEQTQNNQEDIQRGVTIEEIQSPEVKLTAAEYEALKKEEVAVLEEQRRIEKMKKEQLEKARIDQESRQVKQRAPRVGKPKKMFGPLSPEDRPLVLPGGRRWRGPKDAYNEQMIAETLQAQSEIIQGKVLGYESDLLPYDERINFMKYEKPPVSLDHLQQSEVYKLIHNMEQTPCKRVELLTPVVAEADYRERCRSATPRVITNGQP